MERTFIVFMVKCKLFLAFSGDREPSLGIVMQPNTKGSGMIQVFWSSFNFEICSIEKKECVIIANKSCQ